MIRRILDRTQEVAGSSPASSIASIYRDDATNLVAAYEPQYAFKSRWAIRRKAATAAFPASQSKRSSSATKWQGGSEVGPPGAMHENFAVFDFELTADEIARIAGLDTGASLFLDHRDPNVARELGTIRIH